MLSELFQDQIVELLFHVAPCPLAALDERDREAFMLALWACIEKEIERAVREEREKWTKPGDN
jgi:hypothetical protein